MAVKVFGVILVCCYVVAKVFEVVLVQYVAKQLSRFSNWF